MDRTDFIILRRDVTYWRTGGVQPWRDQYLLVDSEEPPGDEWMFAHWFSDWAHVMLARGFLESAGEKFQIISPIESAFAGERKFAILTDWWPGTKKPEPPATAATPAATVTPITRGQLSVVQDPAE